MREIPTSWTVADTLRKAESLALPAFQRGAVWDRGTAARLLESLDDGCFVGSLLIWHPADTQPGTNAQPGAEPLVPGWMLPQRSSMVIDGQQRLRAILSVLLQGHSMRRQAIGEGREAWTGRLWCVRLEVGRLRFSLRGFPGNRQEHDWIPVVFLGLPKSAGPHRWTPGAEDRFAWTESRGRGTAKTKVWVDCELTLAEWRREFSTEAPTGSDLVELERRLGRLLDARLAVIELHEANGRWSEAQVIENYRRLNSAGERLKPEELDYASLVQLARKAPVATHLAGLIRARPGGATDSEVDMDAEAQSSGVEPEDVRRDELLDRGSEREFGLKLFVRTVREVRGYSEARRSADKRLPEPSAVAERPDAPDHWMSEATSVLAAVAGTLRGLQVDWRARIPRDGMGRLRPLELLLIRFPGLRDEAASPVLRAVALRLLIHTAPPLRRRTVSLDPRVGQGRRSSSVAAGRPSIRQPGARRDAEERPQPPFAVEGPPLLASQAGKGSRRPRRWDRRRVPRCHDEPGGAAHRPLLQSQGEGAAEEVFESRDQRRREHHLDLPPGQYARNRMGGPLHESGG